MATKIAVPGGRCLILINQNQVGWGTGVSMQEGTSQFPVRVLGSLYVQRHEAVGIDVSGQMSLVKIYGQNAQDLGLVQGTSDEVLLSPTFDVTIYDRIGGVPLVVTRQCRMTARSWRIDNGSVLLSDVSFVGIQVQDNRVVTA